MANTELENNIDLALQKANTSINYADTILGNMALDENDGVNINLAVAKSAKFSVDNSEFVIDTTIPDPDPEPELPYTELEYIQSTGTQYIDTNLSLGSDNFKIISNIINTETVSAEQAIFSIWTSDYGYWNLFIGTDRYLDLYLNGHNRTAYTISTNQNYRVELARYGSNWIYTLNNYIHTTSYTVSGVNNTTIKLFTRGDTPATNYSNTKIKMYNFKVYINDELKLDLIPVKRKSDNVICMYNKVTNTFFTNQGTGDFIAGPEI